MLPAARGMTVKVYMVVLLDNLLKEGQPPFKILGAKLTHAAAQRIVDKWPGAYIEKVLADKE